MKRKTILKIVVDIGMTVMLLLLMTYELIGEAAHEWIGIGMFCLFLIHHILNRKWCHCVFKPGQGSLVCLSMMHGGEISFLELLVEPP